MNKNFKALEDLQEATKKAEISANEFRLQYEKIFPKRTLKEARFKQKAEELKFDFINELFEENILSKHFYKEEEKQVEQYFEENKRDEIQRKYFEFYGDKFYNFSRRLKNELLKK